MRLTILGLVGMLMLALAPAPVLALPTELEVGRTLKCQSTGPGKELYATIGRIETHTDGRMVVSVSLFNQAPKADLPVLAHVPVDAGALAASCARSGGAQIALSPDFENGYQQWRSAKGGVFTASVDRIYDYVVSLVAKSRQGGPVVR